MFHCQQLATLPLSFNCFCQAVDHLYSHVLFGRCTEAMLSKDSMKVQIQMDEQHRMMIQHIDIVTWPAHSKQISVLSKEPLNYFLSCRLVGDVLLCTGFLSYSGPFNQEFRNRLISSWSKELTRRSIPFTPNLNLTAMLVDNATVSSLLFLNTILYGCSAPEPIQHTHISNRH